MEIEIVEPPRKAIVNKDLRVRALREHWDENSKENHPISPHTSRPRPPRYARPSRGASDFVVVLTSSIAPLGSNCRNYGREHG